MNKIIKWFKDKLGVNQVENKVDTLIGENRRLEIELNKLHSEIHAMDKIDIDVNAYRRGQNTIVLTGYYKGKGYVEFYDIPHEEFLYYVERLQYEKRNNLIRNVDCPPQIKAYFNFK